MAGRRVVSILESGHMKYISDFYISYRRRILTRKEIDNMEPVIQWVLFVCGESDPLGSEPLACGDDDPIGSSPASGG
jgi:hypothetical protein